MIAALYIEPFGCYRGLSGVDPWDEARDARRRNGCVIDHETEYLAGEICVARLGCALEDATPVQQLSIIQEAHKRLAPLRAFLETIGADDEG